MAITSLVLGIVSVCAWFIPLFGCPVTITGIVLGALGIQSDRRTLAYIGLGLSAVFFTITTINAAIGAYQGATGQHPLINQWLNR